MKGNFSFPGEITRRTRAFCAGGGALSIDPVIGKVTSYMQPLVTLNDSSGMQRELEVILKIQFQGGRW